jgi:riboflavin kinase/FMN adenylyltransferase
MRIVRGLAGLEGATRKSVVTIGNFDGVHCGHRMVIAAVRERAAELGAESVAVTFDPHPAHVLRTDSRLPLITPLEQKLDLLAETGLDVAVVLPFTDELRHWTARQFATVVLKDGLHAAEVHEGETFRFGYDAEAGIDGLKKLGAELGFGVRAYEPRKLRAEPVSSSRIRRLIAAGEMAQARALLGRTFSVRSVPASGRGYGTRYAVPTINLAPYGDLLPAFGVYITTLKVGTGSAAKLFHGVTNVGNRPTFGVDSFAVETHLLDFEPIDLFEETPLEMAFLKRLRAEQKFESPALLLAQIKRDVAKAQRYFALSKALAVRSL